MSTLKFKIVTPEKIVYESEECSQVTLPTSDGEITILPNHVSYISSLQPGEVVTKKDSEEVVMAISGGFIEFNNNTLVILADTAERAEEIDLERAEEARKKAEESKRDAIYGAELQYALGAKIQKELARIRVAQKYRKLKGIRTMNVNS